MSYKIVKSVVGGRVIEECDHQDGINPAVTIANDAVYDTGVTSFTGYATFVAASYNSDGSLSSDYSSCMIPFHENNGSFEIGTKIGSAYFSTTENNTDSINVYVEDDELKIQNKTGAAISLSVRF